MNEGMENLKELEKLELIIKKFKQLVTEKESEIEALKKEVALVREQCQIDLLEKDKCMIDLTNINEEHKKINGDLRQLNNELIKDSENLQEKLSKYEDKAAHYRRKAVL
jgi:chromosome segregation ATPase